MEKHILSKSTFIKGYHCLKSLYLYKHRPFLRDKITAEQKAKFSRGHSVGDLAHELFPGGIDVSPKSPSQYQKSVVQTAQLIEQGAPVIYEATFQYDGVLVMLDVLVKTENGWEGYEVKSSKKLSETYFMDAALQFYVIENSGLTLSKFFLIYVDENYRLQEKFDLNQYFILENVTEQLRERQDFIREKIGEEKAVLQWKNSPKVEVGNHCFSPYKCDFTGYCWKNRTDHPDMAKPLILPVQPSIDVDSLIPLSFIFAEQAIPVCRGEKAYRTICLGYQMRDNEAVFNGESCTEKSYFIQTFFRNLPQNQQFLVYDLRKFNHWIKEVEIQYPELKERIDHFTKNTLGILEILEEKGIINPEQRNTYTLSWMAQEFLKPLVQPTIYSDILAAELYSRPTSELFPDLAGLMEYLAWMQQCTSGLGRLL